MNSSYLDKNLSINERVENLLGLMNLEEKIGQMMQLPAVTDDYVNYIEDYKVGSYLHALREKIPLLEEHNKKHSRLQIPLIFGIDAIHGHCFDDNTTVFPTQLAMACSWNVDLLKRVGQITANEAYACGLHWTFSPVLCIGRDPRWGRTDETFGEDPLLISKLAMALTAGYQSADYPFAACAKHFAAYGETDGGRDSSDADVSERKMRNVFLPPFERQVKGGCKTFMAAYESLNGTPCSANTWLMNTILRDEWGFDGVVVTDWDNAGLLVKSQLVANNMKEAIALCLEASNDMFMTTFEFYHCALELVREGRVSEERINQSVRRILKLKFELGLFDQPVRPSRKQVLSDSRRWDTALQAAQESLVLVKNTGLLPLENKKSILLVGDNADDVLAQLGDWSFGSGQAVFTDKNIHRNDTVTLYAELTEYCSAAGIELKYVRGCNPLGEILPDRDTLLEAAKNADAIIYCAGDTFVQHGEFHDRADLSLPGKQPEVFNWLKETGVPIASVMLMSKPHIIDDVLENSQGVIIAFNPGAKGGTAITQCLFGKINPCGKLPISFPRHEGQLPVYYNQAPGWHASFSHHYDRSERYIDLPGSPLLAFGEGLSYSELIYGDILTNKNEVDLSQLEKHDTIGISIDILNKSERVAVEVVQLYIQQIIPGVTSPTRQLKQFKRVIVPAKARVVVDFQLGKEDLLVLDRELEKALVPGQLKVKVGKSSREEDLQTVEIAVRKG